MISIPSTVTLLHQPYSTVDGGGVLHAFFDPNIHEIAYSFPSTVLRKGGAVLRENEPTSTVDRVDRVVKKTMVDRVDRVDKK